jgi:hypothetical protein
VLQSRGKSWQGLPGLLQVSRLERIHGGKGGERELEAQSPVTGRCGKGPRAGPWRGDNRQLFVGHGGLWTPSCHRTPRQRPWTSSAGSWCLPRTSGLAPPRRCSTPTCRGGGAERAVRGGVRAAGLALLQPGPTSPAPASLVPQVPLSRPGVDTRGGRAAPCARRRPAVRTRVPQPPLPGAARTGDPRPHASTPTLRRVIAVPSRR